MHAAGNKKNAHVTVGLVQNNTTHCLTARA